MLSLKSGERLIQKTVFLKIFYLKLAIYLLLYILLLIPISNRNETFYIFLTMVVIYHRLMTNTRSF